MEPDPANLIEIGSCCADTVHHKKPNSLIFPGEEQ